MSLDNEKVFGDAYVVLKAGGNLSICDVVATVEFPEQINSIKKMKESYGVRNHLKMKNH